jgi:CubicO group peptidase (beta-lactamase class C family)
MQKQSQTYGAENCPSVFHQLLALLLASQWLFLGSLLLLCPYRTQADENHFPNKASQIDELVSRYQQCGFLNGAVLVADRGTVLYAKGVGEANMSSHIPITPQTRFGIASITKQFTCVLILQQVAKGSIRLDANISEFLPWYRKDTGQHMTVEQLLHHTSGLPADYDSPQFSDGVQARQHYEPREFAERFCQPDLAAKPGTKWAYCNGGYVLLGLILEQATGKPFGDLLNEQILVPLGMKNTGLASSNLKQVDSAIGYTRHAGPRYVAGPDLDLGHIFSAGAMYSTVEDLFLWNRALSSNALLPTELREQLFKPGLGDWACGWFVTKIAPGAPGAGSTLAEMRGDMPGNFFAWILRYPDQDSVAIVLRNGYGSAEHFEDKIQAILFGQQPAMPARSPKDVLAHAWLVTYASIQTHRTVSLLLLVLALAAVWQLSRYKANFATSRTSSPLRHAS